MNVLDQDVFPNQTLQTFKPGRCGWYVFLILMMTFGLYIGSFIYANTHFVPVLDPIMNQLPIVLTIIAVFLLVVGPFFVFYSLSIFLMSKLVFAIASGKIGMVEGRLKHNEKEIDLKNTKKITFRYSGDQMWYSSSRFWRIYKPIYRYIDCKLKDKPTTRFDYISIDEELIFVKILKERDKENFKSIAKVLQKISGKVYLSGYKL